MRPVSHMKFRLELIEKLLAVSKRKYCSGYDSRIVDSCVGVCQLVVVEAVQLKRDRCYLFVREKKHSEQRHTVYVCFVCRVRLCKSDCYTWVVSIELVKCARSTVTTGNPCNT